MRTADNQVPSIASTVTGTKSVSTVLALLLSSMHLHEYNLPVRRPLEAFELLCSNACLSILDGAASA